MPGEADARAALEAGGGATGGLPSADSNREEFVAFFKKCKATDAIANQIVEALKVHCRLTELSAFHPYFKQDADGTSKVLNRWFKDMGEKDEDWKWNAPIMVVLDNAWNAAEQLHKALSKGNDLDEQEEEDVPMPAELNKSLNSAWKTRYG